MWLSIYQMMFGTALLFTLIWMIGEIRIPMSTTTAAFAWMWLLFRSGNVEQVSSGVTVTTELDVFWLFCLFMALLNVIGLVMWYFGDFPPEEAADDRLEAQPN